MSSAPIVYDASATGPSAHIAELWRFREVIKNFVSQDLKVKYRRSALGFLLLLFDPLLQLTVLSIVFSMMFHIRNLSLYILAGIIPWTFFAATMDGCALSIVNAEGMLRRQYFPKLVFPMSLVVQNLITFVLSLFVLLLAVGWAVGFHPTSALLILPLSFACIVSVALGLGAVAAVVTVYFRDVQHLIGVFISAWFYLTPIIYVLDPLPPPGAPGVTTQMVSTAPAATDQEAIRDGGMIPHKYRFYFKLNPMFAIMQMFHRPIYDGVLPTRSELAAALSISAVALTAGLAVFWRKENALIFAL